MLSPPTFPLITPFAGLFVSSELAVAVAFKAMLTVVAGADAVGYPVELEVVDDALTLLDDAFEEQLGAVVIPLLLLLEVELLLGRAEEDDERAELELERDDDWEAEDNDDALVELEKLWTNSSGFGK